MAGSIHRSLGPAKANLNKLISDVKDKLDEDLDPNLSLGELQKLKDLLSKLE